MAKNNEGSIRVRPNTTVFSIDQGRESGRDRLLRHPPVQSEQPLGGLASSDFDSTVIKIDCYATIFDYLAVDGDRLHDHRLHRARI